MIERQAIQMLVDLAEERDIDDEWHHADTSGVTVRLVGESLSNAFPAEDASNEFCLVIEDDSPEESAEQLVVINVASLLADVCAMQRCISQMQLALSRLEDDR